MAGNQEQAQEDIFAAVSTVVEDAARYSGTARSRMLLDAALAYRYAAGGAQPGSVSVEE